MEIKPSTSIRLCRKRIARTSLPMGLALNRGDKGALVATPAEFIALNNQGEVVARLDGGGAWTCRPTPAGDHVVSSVLHDDGSLIRIHDLAQSTVAEAWSFSDVAIADGFGSQNSNQVLMIAADGSNNGWYHELSILDSSRVPPDAVDVEAGVCEPELAEFADELREAEEPVPVILAEELGTRLFAASICSVLVLEPGQNLRVLAGSMPYGGEADEEDESASMELRHATATDQLFVLSRKDSILAADVYTLCENQPAVLQLSFGLDSLENDEEWVERGGPMPRLGVDSGARWIAYACGKSLACFGLNTSAKIVYELSRMWTRSLSSRTAIC